MVKVHLAVKFSRRYPLPRPGEDFIQLGNGRGWVNDLYISLPPGAGGALHGIPLGSLDRSVRWVSRLGDFPCPPLFGWAQASDLPVFACLP